MHSTRFHTSNHVVLAKVPATHRLGYEFHVYLIHEAHPYEMHTPFYLPIYLNPSPFAVIILIQRAFQQSRFAPRNIFRVAQLVGFKSL